MSDNVVLVAADTKIIQAVDDEAVACLKKLLSMAEAGEINGVCVATVESDGAGTVISVGSAYGGEGVRQNVHAALGAIEAMKMRFARERVEGLE